MSTKIVLRICVFLQNLGSKPAAFSKGVNAVTFTILRCKPRDTLTVQNAL